MAVETKDLETMQTLWANMKEYIDRGDAERKSYGDQLGETKSALAAFNARLDEIETKNMRPAFGGAGLEWGGSASSRRGSPEVKAAVLSYWRKGLGGMAEAERKSLSIADSAHAGFLVPDEIRGPIIERLVLITPFRGAVTTYTISSEAAKVPVERGQYSAYMVSETGTRNESQSSEIGEERIPVHEGVAKIIVSNQLLEDRAFPLESYISKKAAQRIAKLQGQKFVSGTGINEPEGILTNINVGYTASGNASALTPDAFISMAHQLQTFYAVNAKWGFNRKTLGIIRSFKDSQNRYLWEPGLPNANPPAILGIPYLEMPDMPDVAANSFPVVIADFEEMYNWVDRIQMEMQRLTEKYAEQGQVAFLFRTRFGGQVVLAEAGLKMKVSVS